MLTAADRPGAERRSSTCTSPTSRRPAACCGRSGGPRVAGGDALLGRRQRLRRRAIARPDHALDDVPRAIDHERLRVSPDAVAVPHLVVGVDQDRERQPHLLDERLDHPPAILVLAHGEELEVAIAQPLVEPLHRGHLLAARRAPGGPEIQEDHLAAQRREANGLPREVGHGEVWREPWPAVLEPDEPHRGGETGRRRDQTDGQASAARHRRCARSCHPPIPRRTTLVSCASVSPSATGALTRTNSTKKRAVEARSRYHQKTVPSGAATRRMRQRKKNTAKYAALSYSGVGCTTTPGGLSQPT